MHKNLQKFDIPKIYYINKSNKYPHNYIISYSKLMRIRDQSFQSLTQNIAMGQYFKDGKNNNWSKF